MNDVLDWVKDIEETYKYLVEKAEDENQEEIKKYRSEQEEELNEIILKKQKIINDALNTSSIEVRNSMRMFRRLIDNALNAIEQDFINQREDLINTILTHLGFDF